MKIAMVTTVGDRCGIAAYSASLAGSLRKLPDTEVEIVPISVGEQPVRHYEAQAERLNAPDIDLVHIQHEFSFWGFPMPGRVSRFAEFRSMIRRPIVLTAHTPLPLKAIFPARAGRNPFRWLARRRLVSNRDYRKSVEVETFDANATIVHTDAARAEFLGRGLSADRLFVVPMGIPVPAVTLSAGEMFKDKYKLHGKRVLTLFGYVTPNKGYALVAELLPRLPQDIVFVIAGGARRPEEQPYLDHLKRHLANIGVQRQVVITGYLSDTEVADAMLATDIALVPHTQATNSYSVSFPISHGRPTLASNLPCFREMAARGDCVELFENGNGDDLRRKLLALLENDQRRRELATNASRYAERFMWPNVAATTRDVYRVAIERRRAAM